MKLKWHLIVVFFALVLVLLWQLLPSSEPAPGRDQVIIAAARNIESDHGVQAVQVPSHGSQAAPGNPLVNEPDNERAEVPAAPVDLFAKYAGWSFERLAGARAVLSLNMNATINEVLDQRLKQGQFEELILKDGEPLETTGATVRTISEPAGVGLTRYKIIKLPYEEYAQLKLLREEVIWLDGQTQRLSHPPRR